MDRRERIIETATTLFAERGYRGVGLLEIAERVGITHAGILHHFGTKENLLRAVINRRELVRNQLLGDIGEQGLDGFFATHLAGATSMLEPPLMTRLAVVLRSENLSPGDPLHDYFVDRDRLVRDFIAEGIRHGQRSGEYRDDVDPDTKAIEVLSFSLGLEAQWVLDPGAIEIEAVFRSYLRTLLDDLTVGESPRSEKQHGREARTGGAPPQKTPAVAGRARGRSRRPPRS